ncbi:bifunctional copper resistance protein CopD/cytochrome c oxidase assembly protein [Planosporangium flavigriseum]|uniref:Copper resistance D n=1 Tax=Planosporangium flavigriseum TaxID=373681 RepID=A0A8J3PNW1_9ACTN|nr:cytochrome c oxidase assembly protein [Planosporangium flavigriseum]NJC66195.1 bifunctional copper resistance protein CopD/cytochrome c oxidase assembly protein [Planosporangium flavigriseum]GIG76427.1 copper resistance D precursor [Planosporangium flavigriseum]
MTAASTTRRPRPALAVAAVAVATVTLGLLAWYSGATRVSTLPGLPSAGAATVWLLVAARLTATAAATATVGLLLAALVLAPRTDGRLSAAGFRWLRAAGWTAAVWSLAAVTVFCATLADLIARPLPLALSMPAVTNFATVIPLGRAWTLTALAAAAVCVVCRLTWTPRGGQVALVAAAGAVVPPLFTGHAAAAGNHQLAVSALLLHVVPVTLWAGGLLALTVSRRQPAPVLAVAARRFSRLAVWCLVAVALSGLASAWLRLGGVAALFGSRYGHLILIKTVVLAAIAAAGWWQRRSALPALTAGDPRPFRRLAAVEVLLFAVAMGAAAALSRTPPPPGGAEEDAATALLGYPMPPPLTAGALVGAWLPEPLVLSAALAAAGLYLSGARRLRRRGERWPAPRTAAWLAGWAVVAAATSSGLARYAPMLVSVHLIQHLLLGTVAAILLVLAAPVTLALRALPAAGDRDWPGPREWIHACLHARLARVLTHPLVVLGIYAGSLYALYLTGLYELTLRAHAAHLVTIACFLAAGCLFFWVIIGADPGPRRLAHPRRMLLAAASMAVQALLGVALTQSATPIAARWFAQLARPWGPTPLADQHTAGGIAWSFGEIPALLVVIALLLGWARARAQRGLDQPAPSTPATAPQDVTDPLSAGSAVGPPGAAVSTDRHEPWAATSSTPEACATDGNLVRPRDDN